MHTRLLNSALLPSFSSAQAERAAKKQLAATLESFTTAYQHTHTTPHRLSVLPRSSLLPHLGLSRLHPNTHTLYSTQAERGAKEQLAATLEGVKGKAARASHELCTLTS